MECWNGAPSPTQPNEVIDDLLAENWHTVAASYGSLLGDAVHAVGMGK